MRSFDVTVDVSDATGLDGAESTVSSVHVPDHVDGAATVYFAYPGGGYGRKYYDIRTVPGYSQAEHHTAHGIIVVACDHLGVGGSSQPTEALAVTYEDLAAANHTTATQVVDRLRAGSLADGLGPMVIDRVVAMGQSMGGCLLTVQQGNHRTFDGVAFLGWSGRHTNFPLPDGARMTFPDMPRRGTDLHPIATEILGTVGPTPDDFRFCFHWPDEQQELADADLATFAPYTGVVRGDESTPWGSAAIPPCAITMMTEGAVASEAAAIDVPVLVVAGERDVVPDPWAEPGGIRGSRDVAVAVFPRMAHMHNFARTRTLLWDRLEHFARAVTPRARA